MEQVFAEDIATINQISAVQQILEVVCRSTGLGFSAVARVTENRWIACAVRDEIEFGLPVGGELQIETTICNDIRQSQSIVVIDNVAEDAFYCNHHTPRMYGFQSYISVPITLPDGRFFGTLCAIDPKPAKLSAPETISTFKLFADLISHHVHAHERMTVSEAALLDERETARLRDQFIAVLGHDLRNPLAAIAAGAEALGYAPTPKEVAAIQSLIKRSTFRMGDLINDVLDFARGQLGTGLNLALKPNSCLQPALEQVVAELAASTSDRTIESDFQINHAVSCDQARLAQMLSNLLANALTHGTPNTPIQVRAHSCATSFELSVTNIGKDIPPEVMKHLFEPFVRGNINPGQQGLGLGLYIAQEIAKAHTGTLEVESGAGQTCFSFTMPAEPLSQPLP